MIQGKHLIEKRQTGLSFIGLIFILALLAVFVLLAAKVAPTVVEYMSIKKAIHSVKLLGGSVKEMQVSFDKQADVGYISAIQGRDLVFDKSDSGTEISFAYTKKIALVGPASLLLEYEGTTAKDAPKQKKVE
ncbi:MAG: DUF4845 domain-containing protein [Undibacterium sp.]|nr:DUF4845 domain-containing protein [Undibacterium sp.]